MGRYRWAWLVLVGWIVAIVGCKANDISASTNCTLELNAAPCPLDTVPSAVVDCPDGGSCVAAGGCTFQCTPKKCAPNGTTQCAGPTIVQTCIDGAWATQTDCAAANSTCAVATGGVAGCVNCPEPNEVRCSDGQCYDLTSSNDNCGACGKACATDDPHGSAACTNGECKLRCDVGPPLFEVCDGQCVPDLETNTQNCGTCGNACTSLNGTSSCTSGTCETQCSNGYAHCVGPVTVGCETNVLTSKDNCGGCAGTSTGVDCTGLPKVVSAEVSCSAGNCVIAPGGCSPGYADCDDDPANGCESASSSDVRHCGGCPGSGGIDCTALPEVSPTGVACALGQCVINTCATGFSPCGNPATCVDLTSDAQNCSACGNACALPGVTQGACVSGACTVVKCSQGYDDCDLVASNGCETDLGSSNANCGTCANACPASASCASGQCVCPGVGGALCSNACTNTNTDVNNCGGCGMGCPYHPSTLTAGVFEVCSGGTCSCPGTVCTTPGAGLVQKFCSDLQSDRLNCGACNSACPTPPHGAPYHYECHSGACAMVN